jgi:hypothetical protein
MEQPLMAQESMVELPMVALCSDHLLLSMGASDQAMDPMALDHLILLLTPSIHSLLTVPVIDLHLIHQPFIQITLPLTIGHPCPITHPWAMGATLEVHTTTLWDLARAMGMVAFKEIE